MNKIKKSLAGLLVVPITALFASSAVSAQYNLDGGIGEAKGEGVAETVTPGDLVTDVINVALWAVGILAVIMLIWGGIRYATSAGDANKVTAAKNTIMYAVIGLVIAIFAYAVVRFVTDTAVGV